MNLRYILIIASFIFLCSCEKDNYDAPGSLLQGKIVYGGETLNFEANQVKLQLWEGGYAGKKPIEVLVAQDGSYSALLFNGDYRLVLLAGQAPFIPKVQEQTGNDTILVKVGGKQDLDIEVTPYYRLNNPQISVSGSTLSGSLGVEKIITDEKGKDIERVVLFVNKTQFVSGAAHSNIAKREIGGADIADPANITLNLDIPKLNQGYVFARVGVKLAGVESILYSPVQKVELQ